jgi:hypothetical protein
MAYMIESEIMQYYGIPIIAPQFFRQVPGNIIINLGKVLAITLSDML